MLMLQASHSLLCVCSCEICLCPIRLTLTPDCANVFGCVSAIRDNQELPLFRLATFPLLCHFHLLFISSFRMVSESTRLCQECTTFSCTVRQSPLAVDYYVSFFSLSSFLSFIFPNQVKINCLSSSLAEPLVLSGIGLRIAAVQCTRIMAYGNQCAKKREGREDDFGYLSPKTLVVGTVAKHWENK